MIGLLLPAIIVCLTAVSILSAIVLVRAAFIRPRIGALTERAVIAVLIAFFGVVYSVVAFNTELGRALFSIELARILVRGAVIVLLAVPAWWTFMYLTGRLGNRS